jgi:hypothetical protein
VNSKRAIAQPHRARGASQVDAPLGVLTIRQDG